MNKEGNIMPTIIKKINRSLNIFLLLGMSKFAWAITPDISPTPLTPTNHHHHHHNTYIYLPTANKASISRKMIEVVSKTGSIAGSAQACGQNIAELNKRIYEAVNNIIANPTDKEWVMSFYQNKLIAARRNKERMQTMPCADILQKYRDLPMMQDDYKDNEVLELNP